MCVCVCVRACVCVCVHVLGAVGMVSAFLRDSEATQHADWAGQGLKMTRDQKGETALRNGRDLKRCEGEPWKVLPCGSGTMLTMWPVSVSMTVLKNRSTVRKGCCGI